MCSHLISPRFFDDMMTVVLPNECVCRCARFLFLASACWVCLQVWHHQGHLFRRQSAECLHRSVPSRESGPHTGVSNCGAGQHGEWALTLPAPHPRDRVSHSACVLLTVLGTATSGQKPSSLHPCCSSAHLSQGRRTIILHFSKSKKRIPG